MSNAEVIGGVPLLSVIGTPRTMGERLGLRLKPRLQVLAQYLTEQLNALVRSGGHTLNQAGLRDSVHPSIVPIARHEPSLWMEFEAMAQAAELPIEDLLLIHGYSDLLSFFGCQVPPRPSTYVCVDSTHTYHQQPLMAFAWFLDPALLPYLSLLRRMPAHGPATLSLTIAGLQHMVGLSEAGLGVAMNELRVRDGVTGLFTSHVLASMLTAPSLDDAIHRGQAGPRHGGAAIHGLVASGERFTLELSGQSTVRLNDPMLNAPRVHTNHPLDEQIMPHTSMVENSSKSRLERIAGNAVAVSGITPGMIATWFGLNDDEEPMSDSQAERNGASVLVVMDPASRELHLRRSDIPGSLETIKL